MEACFAMMIAMIQDFHNINILAKRIHNNDLIVTSIIFKTNYIYKERERGCDCVIVHYVFFFFFGK